MTTNPFTTTTTSGTTRLHRSATDKKLFGVCGGIGEYFGVDPTIVRLAFVALTFAGGAALPVYILAALIIPEAGAEHRPFDGPIAA